MFDFFKRNKTKLADAPILSEPEQYQKKLELAKHQRHLDAAATYKRLFESAKFDRLNTNWTAVDFSPNQELYNDLLTLKVRARDLYENSPVVNNFVTLMQNNVVGQKGFRFASHVKNSKGGSNTKVCKQIEEGWAEFCKKNNFETSGHYSLNSALDLLMISLGIDGEILMRMWPGMGKHGVQFQLLHSEQLIITQHEEYLLGIKSDEFGKPIKYCITNRHPSDGFIKYEFIPANQIIHVYLPYQVLANRGVPMIFSVMGTIKKLADYREAEIVAARIEASKFVTYSQTQPDDMDPEIFMETALPASTKKQAIQPGMSEILPPGVEAKYISATHPTNQFEPFCRSMQKEIAAGIGLSYNSLYSDYENTSFSSMRAAYVLESAFYKKIQNLIIEHLLTPIFEAWIDCACASGVLDLPPVMGNYDFYKPHSFHGTEFPFSNPLQQSTALGLLVNDRLTSRTKACHELGHTYEEVLDDIEREQAAEKTRNIHFEALPKNTTITAIPEDIGITPMVGAPMPGAPANNDLNPAPPDQKTK